MKAPYHHLLLLLCLLAAVTGRAQQTDYAPQQLIVQLREGLDGAQWARKQPQVIAFRRLSGPLNTWLLQLGTHQKSLLFTQKDFTRDPAIRHVQPNHRLSLRRRPDDPRYIQQWQMRNTGQTGRRGADYNLEAAWDVTTGGVTANGDTIVIASIDNGIDIDHEDLLENIWINRDEIPDNGLDDDGNGYVDDVMGWNTALENNDIEGGGGDHGTSVMGQIAATGNNDLGVTGVNWRAKVMSITNDFDPLESEVIQAYGYALEARKRYDATGGREGAYVVATNASWGRDRGFPSESPIWCAMYDSLGKYGIINVAAVPNSDVDVDLVGDLPALCPSEYLIIVTNVDANDNKVRNAAHGNKSVDLGAYGEGVYTTIQRNGYGPVYGTSFAAPAVTGALGLLYSAPCSSFGDLLRSDPSAAALYVKGLLYGAVRPVAGLGGLTATGGVLDVGTAVQALMEDCGGCRAPTSFAATAVGPDLRLEWKTTAAAGSVSLRYRVAGSSEWRTVAGVSSPYTLAGLPACTTYDLQLQANCGQAVVSTETLRRETSGCCRVPEGFRVEARSGARLLARWRRVASAESYTLRYRGEAEGGWTEVTTTATEMTLEELRNCRAYELELRSNCRGSSTDFGSRLLRKTLGCGVCLDTDYCTPTDYANEQEWIAEVALSGVFTHTSGRGSGGYENFGDLTVAAMVPGGVYPIRLTPGFRGNDFTEDYHVYIDWNQDSQWTEDELVVQQAGSGGKPTLGSITVPEDATIGLTRMRVIMQFSSVSNGACATGGSRKVGGEVEDYCIDVGPVRGCPPPDTVRAVYDPEEDQTRLSWSASAAPGDSYRLRYRERTAPTYTEVGVRGHSLTIDGVDLCTSHEVQIASVCNGIIDEYRTVYLGDLCVGNDDPLIADREWSLAPNPATDRTTVSWSAELGIRQLELIAVDGRLIAIHAVAASGIELEVPTAGLPPGVYLVRLVSADGRRGVKRLLVR